MTVTALLDRFLDDHADKELKPKTAEEYRRLADKLLKPKLGHFQVDAIQTKDVAAAYQEMRSRPTQAALAIRVLSSAMSKAEEWGLREAGTNPAHLRLKGARRRERLFSDAEVGRLLGAIDTLEADKRILPSVALGLRLLFATGCRAGEVMDLRGAALTPNRKSPLRWPDTKTGYLEKPMTDEARRLLEAAERVVGVPWVCPSPSLKRLRRETLEAGFERAMRKANVEARENASLHLLRHWFASKTYSDKSIPLPLAMRIVGHTAVATAMRYAHATHDEVRKAAADAAKRRTAGIKRAAKRGSVMLLVIEGAAVNDRYRDAIGVLQVSALGSTPDAQRVIEFTTHLAEECRTGDWKSPDGGAADFVADWPRATKAARELARTLEFICDIHALSVDATIAQAARSSGLIFSDPRLPRHAMVKFLRALAKRKFALAPGRGVDRYGPLQIKRREREAGHVPEPAVATTVALSALFRSLSGKPHWSVAAAFAVDAFGD